MTIKDISILLFCSIVIFGIISFVWTFYMEFKFIPFKLNANKTNVDIPIKFIKIYIPFTNNKHISTDNIRNNFIIEAKSKKYKNTVPCICLFKTKKDVLGRKYSCIEIHERMRSFIILSPKDIVSWRPYQISWTAFIKHYILHTL